MTARNMDQAYRAATPLELLFDLVTVIAIASAAAGLHHAIAAGHAVDGIVRFAMAFFGIWWAWMNYTWFASAYDNDDTLFRLLTMVIMGGALVMASGIEILFKSLDLTMVVVGYVVMRVAMVALWLRAALDDPARRRTALGYAAGIGTVQVYWTGLLLVGPVLPGLLPLLFALGAAFELSVPALAERSGQTPWHLARRCLAWGCVGGVAPVARQVWTGQRQRLERGHLVRRERGRPSRARRVGQARDPVRVVAMNPVPQRLAIHAASLRRIRPRRAVDHMRDRKNAAGDAAIVAPRRLPPKLGRRVVHPSDRHSHAHHRLRANRSCRKRIRTGAGRKPRAYKESGVQAAGIRSRAICGFVANSIASGTRTRRRRASSPAQASGRYSLRSINAWPNRLA